MAALGLKCVRPLRNLLACSSQFQPQLRLLSSTSYEFVKTDVVGTDGRVGLVTLNRPKALNALCAGLMDELIKALNEMDEDPKIGAIVVTGSEKVRSSVVMGQACILLLGKIDPVLNFTILEIKTVTDLVI